MGDFHGELSELVVKYSKMLTVGGLVSVLEFEKFGIMNDAFNGEEELDVRETTGENNGEPKES
jgi:hypothetical protein